MATIISRTICTLCKNNIFEEHKKYYDVYRCSKKSAEYMEPLGCDLFEIDPYYIDEEEN